MVYILTSSGNVLNVEVRPQEVRAGDPASSAKLTLKLKPFLTPEVFEEQQNFLSNAAIASYVALNKIDQRNRYKASVNLKTSQSAELNFLKGSSSSGLGYSLALFNSFWVSILTKGKGFDRPVFATGEIHRNGEIKPIGHLEEKLKSILIFIQQNNIESFSVCLPKPNSSDIPVTLSEQIKHSGGIIIAEQTLQDTLSVLLGKEYDGDPLGRWEPFKGLKSFDYEDSVRFFGRKKDIERLYDDLRQNNGILIVTGKSGSGKSSLIKAGLIPLLACQEAITWLTTTPSESLQTGILGALPDIFENTGPSLKLKIYKYFHEKNISKIQQFISNQGFILLHIDQFEEALTNSFYDDFIEDFRIITQLVNTCQNFKVVISIRSEYLTSFLEKDFIKSPQISNVPDTLNGDSWREIIVDQAAFSGVLFEGNLAQILIDEAVKLKSSNTLPMVEFILQQLYNQNLFENPNDKVLKLKHFDEMGGIAGAIAKRASQAIKKVHVTDETLNQFFSLFVNVNSDGLPFSKAIEWSDDKRELTEVTNLVNALHQANILTQDKSPLGHYSYKFAHESLFYSWETLKNWIESQKDFLSWKNSIERNFQSWRSSKADNQNTLLIKDKSLLNDAINFNKQGLVNDQALLSYILKSKQIRQHHFAFNLLSLTFIGFLAATIFPNFSYLAPKVEINTLSCNTGGDTTDTLEIFVSNKYQAKDLSRKLCNGANQEITNKYGSVKFHWNSLDESYDLEKLFSGELAVVQSSESSLIASNIIANPDLYMPIVKYPDYYSCIYSRKDDKKPELTTEYFKGKTIGLLNKVYSLSGYQEPYLAIAKLGIFPSVKKFPNHKALENALKDKANGIDLIGSYCPFGDNATKKAEADFNFLRLSKQLKGTTWYISRNLDVKNLKCIIQNYLTDQIDPKKTNEYFQHIEILNREGCKND